MTAPPVPTTFPNEARTRRFAARALVLSPGAQRSPRKRAVPEEKVLWPPIPRKEIKAYGRMSDGAYNFPTSTWSG